MAHSHDDAHTTRRVDVVDHTGGFGSGALIALAAIIVLAVVAFAVLWTQPWDDDGGVDSTPGISDDVVPGNPDVPGTDGEVPGTGGDAPGTDGGSGDGAAPAE